MLLAPGARLGAYEVVAFIGAGGMGEVYKARDTRLDRLVALKVSRADFGERFEREARAVAALNHAHICTLHDVGPNFLVMEYIDGSPLIGPLPLDQALKYGAQIADALDAAHSKHIIHRDLKPANILVTKAGVKLLDFGLARIEAEGASDRPKGGAIGGLTMLTTEAALTVQGTTMGTVPYMSPEQLQGRPADARSDIFAFGLVLYEMLTGKRAFDGSTAASIVGAILERPVPVIEPEPIHRGVNRLIATCVAKDPEDRFQTARDLKRAIEWIAPGVETLTVSRRASRTWIVWAAAAAICAALAVTGWLRPSQVSDPDLTLSIAPLGERGIEPVGSDLGTPKISPDSTFVTYHDRTRTLTLRRMNAVAPEPLQGAGGLNTREVWSTDSRSLVFSDATNLKRIRVPDGAPEIIAKLPGPMLGGTLSDSGTLLFLSIVGNRGGVWTIPAAGGKATEVGMPGVNAGVATSPEFLPGSEDVLLGLQSAGSSENQIFLFTLRDGQLVDPAPLMKNALGARYTPADGGRVLFVRNFNLYSQALNRATRKLEGDEELLQEGVAVAGPTAHYSVSDSGIVVWRPGRPAPSQVTIFDRQGTHVGTAGPPSGGFISVKLSPDERRVLISAPGRSWLLEANQPGRLPVSQGNLTMLWSPGASHVLVPQESRVVQRPLNRAETRELASAPGLERLEDVSADGSVVLFTKGAFADAVFSLRLDGAAEQRVPTPVIQTGEWVWNARFSPDARWIVFQVAGQESGIYVQQFPGPGVRKQITSVGEYPTWRKDGKEIVYLDGNRIWSLPVDTSSGEVRPGVPEALFSVRPVSRALDVSPLAVSRDGSRFYFPQAIEQPDSDVIHVRMGGLISRK